MPHSKENSLYQLRYSIPGRYDMAPYGTIYRVQAGEEQSTELYIQLGDESPQWQKIGTLLELAFKDLIEDPQFIQECLRLYRSTIKEYDDNILAKMFPQK